MEVKRIGQTAVATLAYGLGFRKADQQVERPMYRSGRGGTRGPVIDLGSAEETVNATANVYFNANMRVLGNKLGSAELYVKTREGERTEQVIDHEFETRFRRPNFLFARSDLMEHTMWWLGLDGNAYWWLAIYADGTLAEIWPLPANEVTPIPCKDEVISHYVWKPEDKKMPDIPTERICHLRMVNPHSVTKGMGYVDALRYALEGSDARFKWELDFFGEGRAVPEGLLSVAPETRRDDVERIREELVETYGGGQRRIAVGRAGMVDFKRFALTQEEMAFLDRLKYDEKLFDRVFGFPGGYWDAKANRANAEQAERSLIKDTVMPLLKKIAGNIEVQILDRYYEDEESVDLTCEFEDLTPKDRELSVKEYQAYSGAATFDEARAMAGFSPVEGELGAMPYAMMQALNQMVAQGFRPLPAVEAKAEPETDLELLDDLRNWQQVALKELAKGDRPEDREFYSDHIEARVVATITDGLAHCVDEEDVRAVFEPWLKGTMMMAWADWDNYP